MQFELSSMSPTAPAWVMGSMCAAFWAASCRTCVWRHGRRFNSALGRGARGWGVRWGRGDDSACAAHVRREANIGWAIRAPKAEPQFCGCVLRSAQRSLLFPSPCHAPNLVPRDAPRGTRAISTERRELNTLTTASNGSRPSAPSQRPPQPHRAYASRSPRAPSEPPTQSPSPSPTFSPSHCTTPPVQLTRRSERDACVRPRPRGLQCLARFAQQRVCV